MSFYGGHQCGFFTTNKGTGTGFDAHIQREAEPHAIFTEVAFFITFINRQLQTLDGQRILSTDIHIGEFTANCISRNHHPLNQPIGITFKNRSIHKRTWITLICITDQVFMITRGSFGKRPFQTGRETTAATTAQPGFLDLFDDLIASHGDRFFDPLKTPVGDELIHILSIDDSTTGKDNPLLLLKELIIVGTGDLLCDRAFT